MRLSRETIVKTRATCIPKIALLHAMKFYKNGS